MKEIVFVTSNEGKVKSAQKYFKDISLIPYNYELIEPRSDDIEEIAISKVKQAYDLVQQPCIAVDAGFYIKAINNFPRANVNFILKTIGLKGILKLMVGIEDRDCYFAQCLAYYDGKEIKCFYNENHGQLATEIRQGNSEYKWSELWHIFIPNNCDKTLCEMSNGERTQANSDSISVFQQFADWYKTPYVKTK